MHFRHPMLTFTGAVIVHHIYITAHSYMFTNLLGTRRYQARHTCNKLTHHRLRSVRTTIKSNAVYHLHENKQGRPIVVVSRSNDMTTIAFGTNKKLRGKSTQTYAHSTADKKLIQLLHFESCPTRTAVLRAHDRKQTLNHRLAPAAPRR